MGQCQKYEQHEFSGSLCEELCNSQSAFDNFQCPLNDMKTILFTAEKNGDMLAVKVGQFDISASVAMTTIPFPCSWRSTTTTT